MSAFNGAALLIAASLALAVWFVWRIHKASRDVDQHIESVANLSRAIRSISGEVAPVQVLHIFRCDCGRRIEALGLVAYVDTVRDPRCDDCREVSAS